MVIFTKRIRVTEMINVHQMPSFHFQSLHLYNFVIYHARSQYELLPIQNPHHTGEILINMR